MCCKPLVILKRRDYYTDPISRPANPCRYTARLARCSTSLKMHQASFQLRTQVTSRNTPHSLALIDWPVSGGVLLTFAASRSWPAPQWRNDLDIASRTKSVRVAPWNWSNDAENRRIKILRLTRRKAYLASRILRTLSSFHNLAKTTCAPRCGRPRPPNRYL